MNGKTRENWLKNSADMKFTPGNISYLYRSQQFEIQRKIVEFEGLVHHLNRPKFPKLSNSRSTPTTSGASILLPGRNCNKIMFV